MKDRVHLALFCISIFYFATEQPIDFTSQIKVSHKCESSIKKFGLIYCDSNKISYPEIFLIAKTEFGIGISKLTMANTKIFELLHFYENSIICKFPVYYIGSVILISNLDSTTPKSLKIKVHN